MKAELKEYDCDDQEIINQYDELLDDLGLDNLNLPPASYVLKEVDPIQYQCGMSDFISTLPEVWTCGECGEEYETEEEAEECCKET